MVRNGVRDGVTTARAELTTEQTLMSDFPDLHDEESELFGEMKREYAVLERKGLKGDTLLEAAALRAASNLGIVRKSVASKRGPGDDNEPAPRARERYDAHDRRDDYDDERRPSRRSRDDDRETDAEREERISAQSRPRGERGRSTRERESDDELNPIQISIASKLGVSKEAYKRRARAGVSLSGSMIDR
jgi:hypothetical protein